MNFIIRTDAGSEIGIGHAMRCLALAQALQEVGGRVTFLIGGQTPWFDPLLGKEGFEAVCMFKELGSSEDAKKTVELARKKGSEWVVVDGYHFGSDYQRVIKANGPHLLFLDDMGHADHYSADIVLNQNVYACESLYKSRERYTKLLLGTQYALFRRGFWKWRNWHRVVTEVARNILVTLGGSDPDNVTLKAIEWLDTVRIDGLKINVIIGSKNPHSAALQSAVQSSNLDIELERNVNEMPCRMAWADLAISAGGTTCLELAFMGLPTCTVVIAENQKLNARTLHDKGIVINMGPPSVLDKIKAAQIIGDLIRNREKRHKMSQNGSHMVNGLGAKKVVEEIIKWKAPNSCG